jgi:hypothetical protein
VSIASSPVGAAKDVAKCFGVSPRTVRLARRLTALQIFYRQAGAMRIASAMPDLEHFVSSLAFDETMERLALDVAGMKNTVKGSWKVLVSLQSFYFGSKCGPSSGSVLHVVRPVVPLLTSAADVVHRALFDFPMVRDFTACEVAGAERATTAAVFHFDRDGAHAINATPTPPAATAALEQRTALAALKHNYSKIHKRHLQQHHHLQQQRQHQLR